MVFKGDAELKDFPGNYTDYREWNDLLEEQEKDEKKKAKTKASAPKAQVIVKEKVTKRSFKDKQEFEALEKEIPELEKEKTEIETKLASGNLSTEEIVKVSQQHALINVRIDEKTLRWLELSEI